MSGTGKYMKTIILKRVFTIVFIAIICGLLSWLVLQSFKADVLPIGSTMPELRYFDGNIQKIIKPDSLNSTLIMIFHRNCEHCQYQLSQFDTNLDKFGETIIFLLTPETNFFKGDSGDSIKQKWPLLASSENIYWGVVNRSEFKEKFGRFVFPSVYLFDNSGKLCFKIKGETKLQSILDKLNTLSGPER